MPGAAWNGDPKPLQTTIGPWRARGPVPPVARRGPSGSGFEPRVTASRAAHTLAVAWVAGKCRKSRRLVNRQRDRCSVAAATQITAL